MLAVAVSCRVASVLAAVASSDRRLGVALLVQPPVCRALHRCVSGFAPVKHTLSGASTMICLQNMHG